MKTTTGKNKLIRPLKELFSNSSVPVVLSTLLLCANTVHARGDDDDDKTRKAHTQNRSKDIEKCEKWYAKITGDTSSKPWYNLLTKNNSFLEALYSNNATGEDPIYTLAQEYGGSGDSTSQYSKIMAHIAWCEAYVSSTDSDNYSDKNFKELSGTKESASEEDAVNTQMLQCLNQSDQSSHASCMSQAQQSGNMKCRHEGAETHDYLACKKLATFVKGFTVGKSAMQLQQTYRVGNSAIDAQEDLMAKQNTEEGIGMADTLAVQRDSLEQQGNMAYEMAAYNAAKAGILLSMISGFPTRDGMYEQCVTNLKASKVSEDYVSYISSKKFGDTTGTAIVNPQSTPPKTEEDGGTSTNTAATSSSAWYEDIASKGSAKSISTLFPDNLSLLNLYAGKSSEDICNEVLLSGADDNFFLNQDILDKVKEVAMAAGLEAIANGAQGMLLKKQAGIVDDAIDDIEEFEKPEFEQAGFEPSLTSECVVNPEAEGCITWGGSTTSGFGSQSFGSSATGSANLGSGSLGSDDDTASSASATKRKLIPNSVGSVQIGSSGDGSFSDGVVRPGSIKPGKGGSAGGGGGGGAGSASLPSGGGGGGQGGGQLSAGGKGSTAIRVGSSGGGLGRVSGGRGSISSKSSSKNANPFAKLLGKSKSKNNTLNFRGPAQIGKKKGSLFERISTRYQAVSKADKLLKYEEKKNSSKK